MIERGNVSDLSAIDGGVPEVERTVQKMMGMGARAHWVIQTRWGEFVTASKIMFTNIASQYPDCEQEYLAVDSLVRYNGESYRHYDNVDSEINGLPVRKEQLIVN